MNRGRSWADDVISARCVRLQIGKLFPARSLSSILQRSSRRVPACESLSFRDGDRLRPTPEVGPPRDRFHHRVGPRTLPGLRTGLDVLKARLHRRGGPDAQAPLHPGTRHRHPHGQHPQRKAPVRTARGGTRPKRRGQEPLMTPDPFSPDGTGLPRKVDAGSAPAFELPKGLVRIQGSIPQDARMPIERTIREA
jgi:hypothetical protein